MSLSQLFADLKESWGGNHRDACAGNRWTMIRDTVLRPELECLIAEDQLQLRCDEVKQQLGCAEFNFALFEILCVGLAEIAQVKTSGLVKRIRVCLGLSANSRPSLDNCFKPSPKIGANREYWRPLKSCSSLETIFGNSFSTS